MTSERVAGAAVDGVRILAWSAETSLVERREKGLVGSPDDLVVQRGHHIKHANDS